MAISPYKLFYSWLFDGSLKTPLPKSKYDEDGTEIIPDLLKYNSPITCTSLIRMFLRNGPLNYYLNTYFNNINLRYIQKEELFLFIKKAVIDFGIKQKDITYFPYKRRQVLFEKLQQKVPLLKNDDISLLCDIIESSDEKEIIYNTLGLEQPKKIKAGKTKAKSSKISSKHFLQEHFILETK